MLGITFEETQFYRDIKREGREEGRKEGRQEGRKEGERAIVLRLLTKQVGELPSEVRSQIENLSLEQLENLGEALLDFNSMSDLQTWLDGLK